ncbi:MAG: hypothetical protein IM638_14725 [Bacteroidetes bacterium]|nr:hypothetical protein [Bacteroidota bacterium]
MAANEHLIQRQTFDLQIPSRERAYGLQQEVRAVFDDELLPLINELFDEISGPGEILRINRLELNLGNIDPLRLREQLVTQLKTVLTEKLLEARSKALSRPASMLSGTEEAVIIEHDSYQMDAVLQRSAASLPSLLEAFFLNGDLPWWMPDERRQPDVAELTEQLLNEAPEQFEQLFMQLLKQPQAALRMVNQLPAPLLKRITQQLWPLSTHVAYSHSEVIAVAQYLSQLGVLPAEYVHAPANTPSPVYLMAVAAAARIVTLPAMLAAAARTAPDTLAAWMMVATAQAASTTAETILKAAEITLLDHTAANRVSIPMPEILAGIVAKRISDKQHSLPATAYMQLLETSVGIFVRLHTPAETTRFVAKLTAPAAAATDTGKRIALLFAEEPLLQKKPFISALAEEQPELILRIAQALETENTPAAKTILQEITAVLLPESKKTETGKTKKIARQKSATTEEKKETRKNSSKAEDPASAQKQSLLPEEDIAEELTSTFEQLLELFTDSETDEEESEGISYHNKRHRISRWGGLVILGPYLPALFQETGLLNEKGVFKSKEAAYRAIFLLHYICTGTTKAPEYALTLHKLLCGLPFNKSVPKSIRLTKKEKQEADDLLDAMAEQWTSLRSPFGDAIRQNFLKRTAIIEKKDGAWLVRIQRTSLDILLDSLPWSISVIRLPWTPHLIQTEW